MPTIFEPKDLRAIKKNSASVAMLANSATLGTNALQVERIELKEAAKTSLYEATDAERFIYVIRGTGQANLGQQQYPLEPESVLWFEKEDTFFLEAGADGLEVLLCQAPAGE
jgi:quercetin dioxygenase-like cupin family protein